MSSGEILLAIPARGGSKRLKRKNLLPLGGVPMLVHTIIAAQRSNLSANVYVCTEDEAIAGCAEAHGAKVFRMAPEFAGDLVSSTVPCLQLAESLLNDGRRIDFLFNLQPSSPLRTATDLQDSLVQLKSQNADYLVSATPIDPHYFHWALQEKAAGWEMYFGTEFLKERPLLPVMMRPNGAIKLARFDAIKKTGNFFGKKLAIHVMPEERSIHVATEFDYICSQAVFKAGVTHA
jgi:CMP-N-acetylneuraminic acid synthetase